MEVDEKNEMIEHTIEIDEYVSVTLKIPKVLTAIELKALMYKANKLFNLAEVPLTPGKRPRQKYIKHDLEAKKNIVKAYDKSSTKEEKEELAKKYGMSIVDISKTIYYYRQVVKRSR